MKTHKRILVVSDTHGNWNRLKAAIAQAGEIDALFHLGDGIADAARLAPLPGIDLVCIKGNCDFLPGERTREFSMGGFRFFLAHGDQFGVKYSLLRFSLQLEALQAQAGLFGLTHQPFLGFEGGRLLLNPGSLGNPRGGKPTFALLDLCPEGIFPKIMDLRLTRGC